MLLKWLRLPRLLFSTLPCCFLPLLLSACGVQVDTSHTSCAAPEIDGEFRDNRTEESRFPLRRDHSPDQAKAARVARMRNPNGRPTYREQREARALVMAEADLYSQGGLTTYLNDGSASNPGSVKFVAKPSALTLSFRASPRLNHSDGVPHALTLVVYHLGDRAALDQLVHHEDGIRRLLEADFFDPSVRAVRRHDIQPGAAGQLHIDRPEGGRYVAVVAGYGTLRASTSVYVTEYGMGEWRAGGATQFHKQKRMFTPLPLALTVTLNEQDMLVHNSGRILGNMKRVTSLSRQQMRYLPANQFKISQLFSFEQPSTE